MARDKNFDPPCVPDRGGRHEWYANGNALYCRRCGLRTWLPASAQSDPAPCTTCAEKDALIARLRAEIQRLDRTLSHCSHFLED